MTEAIMFWLLVLCAGYFIGAIWDRASKQR